MSTISSGRDPQGQTDLTGPPAGLAPFRFRGVLPVVVVALGHIGQNAAIASVIFDGQASHGLYLGLSLFLFGSIVASLSVAASRNLPAPVYSTVQNAPVAVLIAALLATIAAQPSPDAALATVLAIMGCTALVTGVAMLVLSWLDFGRIVNFMPYPVSAGFLAGSGALLVMTALRSAYPADEISLSSLAAFAPGDLVELALTVVLAGVLLAARRVSRLGVITVLGLAIGLTFVALHLAGIDLATARSAGVFTTLPPEGTTALPRPALLWQIDWRAVLAALPTIMAASFIALIGTMLGLTGIEMVLGSDMRSRTVLARCGLANILGGGVGAPPAYGSASLTAVAAELGPSGRGSIQLFCGLLAVAAFFSATIIAVIPSFVFSGLLMFIGCVLIDRWFVSLRRRMRRGDWLLTGVFVVVTLVLGIVVAIQLGIVVASVMFAISYARLKVVRATSDLRTRRSSVDRGPAQSAWLDAHGGEVKVLSLQGYLFFGSVEQLAETLRDLLDGDRDVRRILIDLARVRDIDAAAVAALMKVERLARPRGVVVVLCDLTPPVAAEMDRLQDVAAVETLRRAASLDEALEEAEDWLLSRMPAEASEEDALTALQDMLGSRDAADRLLLRMTRQDVPAGETLIRAGETTTEIYFVHEGQLDIHLPGEGRRGRRLRAVRGGAFVGEMANYANLPRTADVIAQSDCVVYTIDAATLDRLRDEEPDLLALFHRMIASALADKVQRTNRLLSEAGA